MSESADQPQSRSDHSIETTTERRATVYLEQKPTLAKLALILADFRAMGAPGDARVFVADHFVSAVWEREGL